MSEKLKACAIGCPTTIVSMVDEYKSCQISERGSCQKVAIETNKYANAELYSAQNIRDIYRNTKGLNKVVESSPPWTGQYESYTPEKYIESARIVMGSIDLDPASNEQANETVKASKYFNIDDDGLAQNWFGKIFLNPPYKQPEIENFIIKLTKEYSSESIDEAILLTNNNTDTDWFKIASELSIMCFTDHRIKFELRDGKTTQPTTGQIFFYFGENKEGFKQEFKAHGLLFERI